MSVADEGYSIKTGIKSTDLIEFDAYKGFEVYHSIDFNVPALCFWRLHGQGISVHTVGEIC